jgi:hypothetical protein
VGNRGQRPDRAAIQALVVKTVNRLDSDGFEMKPYDFEGVVSLQKFARFANFIRRQYEGGMVTERLCPREAYASSEIPA